MKRNALKQNNPILFFCYIHTSSCQIYLYILEVPQCVRYTFITVYLCHISLFTSHLLLSAYIQHSIDIYVYPKRALGLTWCPNIQCNHIQAISFFQLHKTFVSNYFFPCPDAISLVKANVPVLGDNILRKSQHITLVLSACSEKKFYGMNISLLVCDTWEPRDTILICLFLSSTWGQGSAEQTTIKSQLVAFSVSLKKAAIPLAL